MGIIQVTGCPFTQRYCEDLRGRTISASASKTLPLRDFPDYRFRLGGKHLAILAALVIHLSFPVFSALVWHSVPPFQRTNMHAQDVPPPGRHSISEPSCNQAPGTGPLLERSERGQADYAGIPCTSSPGSAEACTTALNFRFIVSKKHMIKQNRYMSPRLKFTEYMATNMKFCPGHTIRI